MRFLVIHKHESICSVVLRLIKQQPEWDAVATDSIDEACFLFENERFDLVLLGSGLEQKEEIQVRNTCSKKPAIPIIQHYGGGSGLLVGEIRYALEMGKTLG